MILQTSKVGIIIWTNINIYIYMYICICICKYIYIHIYETCSIKEILQLLRHCIRGKERIFMAQGGEF